MKLCSHDLFDSLAGRILPQPEMEAFLDDLGILWSINLALSAKVDRNPIDLAFLFIEMVCQDAYFLHALGRIQPVVGGRGNADRLANVWQCSCGEPPR